jgi:hypothetical protein
VWRGQFLVQTTINPVSHTQAMVLGLDVDIRSTFLHGRKDDEVHQLDDRTMTGNFFEI